MRRGRFLAWGSTAALILLVAGAASFSLVTHSASPNVELTRALNATLGSSGYVTVTSDAPLEKDVANAPNLTETIVEGRVTQIWEGHTIYSAVPAGCATKARFVEDKPSAYASFTFFSATFSGFKSDAVSQSGDTFTVMKKGTLIGRYIVQDGFVVEEVDYPRNLLRVEPPPKMPVSNLPLGVTAASLLKRAALSAPAEVTQWFREIGRAPEIVVPPPSEVVLSPTLRLRGCPS